MRLGGYELGEAHAGLLELEQIDGVLNALVPTAPPAEVERSLLAVEQATTWRRGVAVVEARGAELRDYTRD
jgi:hypothetical protein